MPNAFDEYETPMLNQAARRAILRRDELRGVMRSAANLQELEKYKAEIRALNKLLGIDHRGPKT